jgi:hypothetical protein
MPMDANQIELFVNTYIRPGEGGDNPRLSLELDHFIKALQECRKEITPVIIKQAWGNWKTERFEYINNMREHQQKNIPYLQKLAYDYVSKQESNLTEQLESEARIFSEAFGRQLQFIARQPSEEQIASAWQSWKKGYRY